MKSLWIFVGRIIYALFRPVFARLVRDSERARVLIIHEDACLVMQDWIGSGQWVLPGGGLHRGEDPITGACREVAEETGIKLLAKDLQPAGAHQYAHNGFQFRYQLYVVRLSALPNARPRFPEVVRLAWVDHTNTQGLKLAPDVLTAVARWPN